MIKKHDLETLTGLYHKDFEKDNCGLGLIAKLDNKPTRKVVDLAISSLCNLTHRGGLASDQLTGDGCGLLIGKPNAFFQKIAQNFHNKKKLALNYAVGVVFLSQHEKYRKNAEQFLDEELKKQGLEVVAWRAVPVDSQVLGEQAKNSEPIIKHIFVNAPTNIDEAEFNRRLFLSRRFAEMLMVKKFPQDKDFYIGSLHSRTIVYKGLMLPKDLAKYYVDLADESFTSSICSYHQRFSTNTLPQWRLAQPFRFLAHNGELNTIRGNRNWARSRAKHLISDKLPDLQKIDPIVSQEGSDSTSLDNMLEVLHMGGLSLTKSIRLLIPPAWENNPNLTKQGRAYFDFYSHHVESWDGPAGIMLHDGISAICALDRNGLRPSRYIVTKDGYISFASEVGVMDCQAENIVEKGRLHPGDVMEISLQKGIIINSNEITKALSSLEDYGQWLNNNRFYLKANPEVNIQFDTHKTHQLQKYYGVTFEERDQVLRVLAEDSQEATISMGDDAPLPVFSDKVRSLYDFFRQIFAQVTNPPIDSLREKSVMSLTTILGKEPNVFTVKEEQAKRLQLKSPVLLPNEMQALLEQKMFKVSTISLHYDADISLEQAIDNLCAKCLSKINDGNTILHLSDNHIVEGQLTIHMLIAVGALHHFLIDKGHRNNINIVAETATARDSHHIASLLGYGTTLIYPYLAYLTFAEMMQCRELKDDYSITDYCKNYVKAINKGLLKIFSKMGISTVASYRGAQLFEIVGLADTVVEKCFKGSVSRIAGFDFEQLQKDQKQLAELAFNNRKTIQQGGYLKYVYGGEEHAYNPKIVDLLRTALQQGDQSAYNEFKDLVNNRKPIVIRDYLQLNNHKPAIEIDQVEAKEELFKRFDCAGISMGALSTEAHEAIAIAMNTLGARSNSGEGGEDPIRFNSIKNSKIKQVASGRFGVTTAYLMSAEVVQIKIAQGAKPGEGGQLPGNKVDGFIAKLRHSTPGVTLISPPPHHDIYSIEDLAQLIYDLKQVNPALLVSVKLVSAPGVGTVAAGVAKTYADLITISGYDGGTGASPLTSVKYAGSPFELGLSEARQVLRANDLRGLIRLQTDGGLKTGLDVVKAAILGAESFGFGTAPMIALGCKYLRICHLNICPVGVATQNDRLRKEHFNGLPQMVINYFEFVAEEVRQILAQLGVKKLADIIGKTEYLKPIKTLETRQSGIDLNKILSNEGIANDKPHYCQAPRNNPWDKGEKNEEMLQVAQKAIDNNLGGIFNAQLKNTERSIGARISGFIAKKYGNKGMEKNPIVFNLNGIAGQSFGVWNVAGLHMNLRGDANDYVGKGMSGGKIVIAPPEKSSFPSETTPIVGNTCLYGATGGQLLIDGIAGERFAVRNSGAIAVLNGMGEHGCEYMTGGMVISLGQVGTNFGAGMSGGCAMIYDPNNSLKNNINQELIEYFNLIPNVFPKQIELLKRWIKEFVKNTKSTWGQTFLDEFDCRVNEFKFIKPKEMTIETLMQMVS